MSVSPDRLNFHHLHYFWAVAKDGNLTRTAKRLRVSQSALSSQIRQLEEELGEPLFSRRGRGLELTEAGRIALDYAEDIFSSGAELVTTLKAGRGRDVPLSVGAVATLSRNFVESFVKPLFEREAALRLRSGSLEELLVRLEDHALDVVLSNRLPPRETRAGWRTRRLARQMVSIVGNTRRRGFRFPDDVDGAPMILPGRDSAIRSEFDALSVRLGFSPRVLAEIDDMATMRLFARDAGALALLPSVVVRDELQSRTLFEHCVVPELFETFHAITVERHYPHPLLRPLLARDEKEVLAMGRPRRAR